MWSRFDRNLLARPGSVKTLARWETSDLNTTGRLAVIFTTYKERRRKDKEEEKF